jgi:hypothetical protein
VRRFLTLAYFDLSSSQHHALYLGALLFGLACTMHHHLVSPRYHADALGNDTGLTWPVIIILHRVSIADARNFRGPGLT